MNTPPDVLALIQPYDLLRYVRPQWRHAFEPVPGSVPEVIVPPAARKCTDALRTDPAVVAGKR